jgi:prepilin-type N-terminal cleavage/methylation domain-containing protein
MLYRKQIHVKKGMTLIELVAAIAILGVVMAAIMSLFMTGINFFRVGNLKSQVQSDARLAVNSIVENIKFASELTIMNHSSVPDVSMMDPQDNYNYFVISSGTMYHIETNGSSYSMKPIARSNQSYQFSFSNINIDNNTLRIVVTVTESGETFNVSSDIALDNFVLSSSTLSEIKGLSTGDAIRYRIKPPGES